MAKRETSARGWAHLAPRLWGALPILLLMLLGVVGAQSAQAAPQARSMAPSVPSFNIVNPAGLAGPAGTNVTAKITGAHKGQVFNIAYARANPGCSAVGASSSNLPTVTIGSDGTNQFSFSWPADSGTGTFVLCAQDASVLLTVVQSQESFTVLSTTPPAISIQAAPEPTPTGGNNSSGGASGPQSSYTTGESVIVQGTGFLPGGTSVQISLASSPNGGGTQLSQGAINADTSGSFTTTVTLPSFRIGNLYIQAVTTDSGTNQPASLRASTPITITLPPTATPQPSPTVSPTAAATATGGTSPGGSSGGGNNGTLRILGIAGLGSFSVLLLLVGAALLISAGGGREA